MGEDEDDLEEEESDDESEEEKEPEIDVPKDIYAREMQLIKQNPMKYIGDWAEGILLHVGRRAFRVISLMPCSLIIPSIPFGSSDIRANLNVFILGSPSAGKSTMARKFLKFTYHGIPEGKSRSARKLVDRIVENNGMFSISYDDFSVIFDQADGSETVKILEGAIGDEKFVGHETMTYTKNIKTQAIGFFAGTFSDLSKYTRYLQGGLLSRMSLLFLSITDKQRKEISQFINDNIGNATYSRDSIIKEKIIKDYYQLLFNIQAQRDKSIPQVCGYHFDTRYKGIALETHASLTKECANDMNGDFKREFHDFYRYLISHAFLNIYNREVKDGILYPIKEDYDFALSLMKETLGNKIMLIKSRIILKNIDSPMKFLAYMNEPRLKEDVKNILRNLSPYGKMMNNNINPLDKNKELRK